MKEKLLFIVIFFLFLGITSCKKEETKTTTQSPTPSTAQSGGSFIFNTITYNVTSATKTTTNTNLIWYSFNSYNSQTFLNRAINFYFAGTSTPANGTYSLVSSTVDIGSNQVYVMATDENGVGFESNNVSTTLTVSVSGGQVSFKLNNTNLTEVGGSAMMETSANSFIKL